MIFSGQNMKSKAVSSCQQNIKILYQALSALCTKALCVQVPLTQISMYNHLTYIHAHLCEYRTVVSAPVCLYTNIISRPCAKNICYSQGEFPLGQTLYERQGMFYHYHYFHFFFPNEETENERTLLKLILFF